MGAVFERVSGRILIVDDDIDLLMLLERRLLKEGYTVETACSLPEAEELLSYFQPDLILLDINVNGEDGRQLCWKLKRGDTPIALKVVIMSGYDLSTARAALFGADELITKPIQTDYLLQRIGSQLQNGPGITVSTFLPFPDKDM